MPNLEADSIWVNDAFQIISKKEIKNYVTGTSDEASFLYFMFIFGAFSSLFRLSNEISWDALSVSAMESMVNFKFSLALRRPIASISLSVTSSFLFVSDCSLLNDIFAQCCECTHSLHQKKVLFIL